MKSVKLRFECPRAQCPYCRAAVARHSLRRRIVYEEFVTYDVEFDYYRCARCKKGFKHPGLYDIAWNESRWGVKLQKTAMQLREAGKSLDQLSQILSARTQRRVPMTTIHGWLHQELPHCPKVELLKASTRYRGRRKTPKTGRELYQESQKLVESLQETCSASAENA